MTGHRLDWKDILNIPVSIYQKPDGNQLLGFLENRLKKSSPHFLFDGASELKVVDGELFESHDESLALLVYAGLNPGKIALGKNFSSALKTNSEILSELRLHADKFFKGTNLVLPKNRSLISQFSSFEQWSGVNEVTHISLWLLTALEVVMGRQLRVSLEVEIPLPGEPRPGRLDVVAELGTGVLILEAKTSSGDAVKDRRFVEQIPKYRKAISEAVIASGSPSNSTSILLALGGNELDFLAENSELRVTPTGEKLIELCNRHKIRFVTANAIWQFVALKVLGSKREIDAASVLLDLGSRHDFVGLTSGGFISADMTISSFSD